MSRARQLSLIALGLCACTAPGLKDFNPDSAPGAGSTSSTSTSDAGSSTTAVMTSSEGSDSGTESTGDTSSTTSTGEASGSSTGATGSSTGEMGSSTAAEAVCGDGIVEGDEECDDEDGKCHQCVRDRWVFATQAIHDKADFGDLASADDYCKQYAYKTGLADTTWTSYIAWLSDSNNDVRDRLYRSPGRYVRTDGVVVAMNGEQFLSGMLEAPINVDEYGDPAPGTAVTGTQPDGTAVPGTHCDNWTSTALLDISAYEGHTGSVDGHWTKLDQPAGCAGLGSRLYCIEGK